MDMRKAMLIADEFNYEKMILAFCQMVIGFLFLGNQRLIVNFIESGRRQATAGKE